jgi:hypothetical protein
MEIHQVSDSRPQTLEQFYTAIQAEGHPWDVYGQMMLVLLRHLRQQVAGGNQWAYTSHNYLVLSDVDRTDRGRVWISVNGSNYRIEYFLPRDLAPWPNAKVVGFASTVAEASQMIVAALHHAPREPE